MQQSSVSFAPQLYIPNGTTDISFYTNALGANEHFCLRNDDGSVHVAEFDIDGAVFHLHEESIDKYLRSPLNLHYATAIVGLFVPDVAAIMQEALAAGAKEIIPTTDYDYGYRQATFQDPFGHYWMLEKKI